jgi:hypothetical protein
LLDIVNRATEHVQQRADELGELAELNAPFTADRLSWDDTAEGERLRRYEVTCERAWSRAFDLFMKIRRTGGELDLATIARLGRSVPYEHIETIDRPAPTVANVVTPPAEPVTQPNPPIEAESAIEKAPNEANSDVQAVSTARLNGHKEHRTDTPHLDHKPGGIGSAAKTKSHPVLERVLNGRESTLLNLTSIFGER